MPMNTAKLLLLNVLGGGGIPESITDDFAVDTGRWLDGNLAPAALTISGGRAVWSPALGAEKIAYPELDSWSGGKPDGWNVANSGDSAVTETAADGSPGNGAAKVSSTTAVSRPLIYGTGLTASQWNLLAVTVSAFTAGTFIVANSATEFARITGLNTHYVAAYSPNDKFYLYNSALPLNMVFDRISSTPITLSTMFRVQKINYPSSVSVKARYLRATPIGVAVFKDVSNWVAAVIAPVATSATANQVTLFRCVAGALSQVTSAAITYAADAVLQLTPAADFQTWSVSYGGSAVISGASIIDFAASGEWYAGMVTTRDAGDTAVIGFDDFMAARVAGAPPF